MPPFTPAVLQGWTARIAEGDARCDEYEWVTAERVTTSEESHVVSGCRHCSAVSLIGPELHMGGT